MHAQSYLTLSRPLEPYSLPGSSLSKEIFRQEYWSGLSFPHQGDLSHPGIKPVSPASPALAGGFFYRCAIWETLIKYMLVSVREKAMAPHSSTLAWEIPWMVEPGRLQFMGSLRVRHDWVTSLSLFTFMHWRRKWQPTPVFLPGESQGPEPGGLLSMGSHRVGHDWSDLAAVSVKRSQSEKAACCLIPTRWHLGKGKTMETVKDQRFSEAAGEGELDKQQVDNSGFLGQWKSSAGYYNNGHLSLYISPNP